MKNNTKIILAFISGICISVLISVTASTIINSKDVFFDNSESNLLLADINNPNVQDAIDATYTKTSSLSNRILSIENSDFQSQIDKKQDVVDSEREVIEQFDIEGDGYIYAYRIGEIKCLYISIDNAEISSGSWIKVADLGVNFGNKVFESGGITISTNINRLVMGMYMITPDGELLVYSNSTTTIQTLLTTITYI